MIKNNVLIAYQKIKSCISFFAISITFILVFESAVHSKNFELRKVSDANAVCNNGKVANYQFAKAKKDSDKWLIQFEGGGSGWPAKYFKDRDPYMKRPAKKGEMGGSAIAKQFHKLGYNVIWIHYCSSDLYGGNHINSIDGKEVPFKGRLIIKSIINEHAKILSQAQDIVIAGTSAGAYGITLNLDLLSSFNNVRLILDGIWRDDFQKSAEVEKPDWFNQADDWVPYLLSKMPEHCEGDFYKNCWVDRKTLDKHNIKNAFIIMNYGDPYNFVNQDSQKEKFISAFKSDAEYFGGGFSIDAKKFKLAGAVKWGHALLAKDKYYNKKIDGESLASLIEQWVNGKKPIHIRY
jgi:hypothetical protein